MEMMDALVKAAPEKGLVLTQVPKPVPGMGEVLIKIHKTAICGTDVHIYNWNQWAQETIKPPMVIGHEYVGEIAELGPGVTAYHVGQIVSGEGHIVCGHCRNCHTGNIQWCKDTVSVGVDRDGAFAEYVCIPESNVILIDESLDEDVVAFFDAFGNATHTALMFPLIGEDVLITGAGPIGIIAIFVADGHRGLDVQLGPGIPVENVNVSTADGGLVNLNKNLTGAGNRHGNLPQFQAGTGSGLNDGVHKLSHV